MSNGYSIDTASLQRAMARIAAVGSNVVPEATRLAVNDVAFQVFFENKKLIDRSFDNPTAFTRNAFMVKKATSSDLVAVVERKPMQSGKHYLEVQSEGGPRGQTGLERLLSSRLKYEGIIQSVLPTKHTRRVRNGSVSGGLINQILSAVQAQGDGANNATVASKKRGAGRKRAQYFVPRVDSKLSAGVYERKGKDIRKILAFSDKTPRYNAQFPMVEHATKVASDAYEPAFERAFLTALART